MSPFRGSQSVLLLILALSVGSVGCPPHTGKLTLPEDVLVADRAVAIDVSPDDLATGLKLPRVFKALSANELKDLAVYRIGTDELESLSFDVDGRRLRGNFAVGSLRAAPSSRSMRVRSTKSSLLEPILTGLVTNLRLLSK